MTKSRLTLEEHIEMGRTLAAMRDDLTRRSVRVSNAYPRSGPDGIPGKKIQAAINALDEARRALEDALFRDHPDEGETTVYYPHQEDRPRITR